MSNNIQIRSYHDGEWHSCTDNLSSYPMQCKERDYEYWYVCKVCDTPIKPAGPSKTACPTLGELFRGKGWSS